MGSGSAQERIAAALKLAADTRLLRLGRGTISEAGEVFASCFGARPAVIVADANTFAVAGRQVADVLKRGGVEVGEPFIFDDPELHAYFQHVETLEKRFAGNGAIPVAVGSGTINDLTKLAAHRCGRGYMTVATAASMDGYTAFGASVTHQGSKQTFFCPAPVAVIADLDVIGSAPADMNAAGYADLVAKVTAGADWIVSDALGIEAIDPQSWKMVQEPLREWASNPGSILAGEFDAIAGLIEGLLMTGFAMQWSKSSRPASGAEHQFSHLWDMQHHQHKGHIPFHGYKVAIGTMASTLMYEQLFEAGIESLDIERVCAAWPELAELQAFVDRTHEIADLKTVAGTESTAKYVTREQLAGRLRQLKAVWPDVRKRLQGQLIPSDELRAMLGEAGAPNAPQQIGIGLDRLKRSHIEAQQIRRRYTVLDLAVQTGLMDGCLKNLFASDGAWTRTGASEKEG